MLWCVTLLHAVHPILRIAAQRCSRSTRVWILTLAKRPRYNMVFRCHSELLQCIDLQCSATTLSGTHWVLFNRICKILSSSIPIERQLICIYIKKNMTWILQLTQESFETCSGIFSLEKHICPEEEVKNTNAKLWGKRKGQKEREGGTLLQDYVNPDSLFHLISLHILLFVTRMQLSS